eukprot:scaffold2515_cov136-Amphora_coffeaeformis.AAC.1
MQDRHETKPVVGCFSLSSSVTSKEHVPIFQEAGKLNMTVIGIAFQSVGIQVRMVNSGRVQIRLSSASSKKVCSGARTSPQLSDVATVREEVSKHGRIESLGHVFNSFSLSSSVTSKEHVPIFQEAGKLNMAGWAANLGKDLADSYRPGDAELADEEPPLLDESMRWRLPRALPGDGLREEAESSSLFFRSSAFFPPFVVLDISSASTVGESSSLGRPGGESPPCSRDGDRDALRRGLPEESSSFPGWPFRPVGDSSL